MRDDTMPSFRNSFFALSLTLEKVLLERKQIAKLGALLSWSKTRPFLGETNG